MTVRLSEAAAQARIDAAKDKAEEEGGQRMSTLQFGLTPKMKPLSPKRSALVAALDVGTSKIACLIARLKPRPPQDVLRRRSHSVEVIGFGHTLARGMKAGAVVDLAEAEAAVRQCADLAERTARMQLELGHGLGVRRAPGQRAHLRLDRVAGADDRRTRHRPRARRRQPPFRARRAAPCCIRCRSATRSTTPAASAIRAACWRATSASTCTS